MIAAPRFEMRGIAKRFDATVALAGVDLAVSDVSARQLFQKLEREPGLIELAEHMGEPFARVEWLALVQPPAASLHPRGEFDDGDEKGRRVSSAISSATRPPTSPSSV